MFYLHWYYIRLFYLENNFDNKSVVNTFEERGKTLSGLGHRGIGQSEIERIDLDRENVRVVHTITKHLRTTFCFERAEQAAEDSALALWEFQCSFGEYTANSNDRTVRRI